MNKISLVFLYSLLIIINCQETNDINDTLNITDITEEVPPDFSEKISLSDLGIEPKKYEILDITPDKEIYLKDLYLNEKRYFMINNKDLLSEKYYKIMVHYIGALGINFKINIICEGAKEIIKTHNKNIKLNDFSEYDFKTNKEKIPNVCNDTYDEDFLLISLEPFSHTYQLKNEREIKFNAILEVISNKVNNDIKPINILTNKGVYKALIVILVIIPLLLYIFKEKIRGFLLYVIGKNDIKEV